MEDNTIQTKDNVYNVDQDEKPEEVKLKDEELNKKTEDLEKMVLKAVK